MEADLLLQHKTDVPMGVVPDWAQLLTGGVDVQMGYFYWKIDAWGPGVTCQTIAYGRALTLYPAEVSAFLERGGSLAWGIVPNNESAMDETPSSLADMVDGFMADLAAKGVDPGLLARRSLVTPQCGLGGADPALVPRVLELLRETSEELRRRHP